MIRETELNLFVPSPELLVRLASGEKPLGVRAGPPRIKSIRETFFDTVDQSLRRRGMTCKLRQVEGESPSVVVTVGEGPDSEGITSRSRLTAASVGAGVFETLRGDSEPAAQIQKFVDPGKLRPQIALDIQRLGRVFRGGLFLKPVLLLFFDRIAVQTGGATSVFHEISLRRRRDGGPEIRDLARKLRDEYHLFPDGLSRLQRAYRILAMEGKSSDRELSPYGLNLALAVFHDGRLGLRSTGGQLLIPTFRGSGEDAARALSADLVRSPDLRLLRLGTTEPREGRATAELWTIPDGEISGDDPTVFARLQWIPWNDLLEQIGSPSLRDPTLISTLLLLTRRRLLGQLPWLRIEAGGQEISDQEPDASPAQEPDASPDQGSGASPDQGPSEERSRELARADELLATLRRVEDPNRGLEERLEAVSALADGMGRIFSQDVTRAKGRILSADVSEGEGAYVQLVDLLSIRVRGIVARLYHCFLEDLSQKMEQAQIHIRPWEGLMNADRVAVLEEFRQQHLPRVQVAPEWGPSFIPDMPMAGTALGILARFPGVEGPRFFHMVLGKDLPSFLPVPGSSMVVPLEEVIRGYFIKQTPELERAESHMFRFTTGAALVRELAPEPEPLPDEYEDDDDEKDNSAGEPVPEAPPPPPPEPSPAPAPPEFIETRQSVVVQVLAHQSMPETYQAQLLRALERQVSRRNPLIGWSDLYPVTGPLDLGGLDKLMRLRG